MKNMTIRRILAFAFCLLCLTPAMAEGLDGDSLFADMEWWEPEERGVYFESSILVVQREIFGKDYEIIQSEYGLQLSEQEVFPWWGKDLKTSKVNIDGSTVELLFQYDKLALVYCVCGDRYDYSLQEKTEQNQI